MCKNNKFWKKIKASGIQLQEAFALTIFFVYAIIFITNLKERKMDIKFMRAALREAQKAEKIDEAPVGAVVVLDGKIIARGYNKRETKQNALMHAEIIAIEKACKKLGSWRLDGCCMYVTLEPCPMCAGAIIQSRIEKVYFGAYDKKAGCFGSVCDISKMLPHKVEFDGGILQEDCENIIKNFFKKLRKREK